MSNAHQELDLCTLLQLEDAQLEAVLRRRIALCAAQNGIASQHSMRFLKSVNLFVSQSSSEEHLGTSIFHSILLSFLLHDLF